MKFKAVIFDKDGVIIDTQPIHYQVYCDFCVDFEWPISKDEYESFIGMTSFEMFNRLKDKYGTNYTVHELVEMFQLRYVNLIASLENEKPILGVDVLIKALHSNGIKLAVASSATRKKINLVLNMFELKNYFEVTVSGYEVPNSKPAPDIFLRAAYKLGVLPEECVVIEDSYNGIVAAKLANMRCIGYRNPIGKQDLSKADLVVDNFLELSDGEFVKGNF